MESILIYHKDHPEITDIREDTEEVTTLSNKTDILNNMNISYGDVDLDDYRFFNENKLCKESKMYEEYIDTLLEIYFPSKWDVKSQKYLYYLEDKKFEEKPFTIYTHEWNNINLTKKISKIHYVQDTKEPQKRAVIITSTD